MLHTFGTFVASIPSPGSGAIHIGKLQLRAYGLMIALGALAAVWLAGKRLEESGHGKRDDMSAIAMWALPAGVVGARLYHVITDWKSFRGDWLRAFKIWEGGLGIWGGIALGTVFGLRAARKRGLSTAAVLRAAAPALPLGQAIARWGNWWNQELFGGPTSLPWGLEIDAVHRPAAYVNVETFHPVFLYESLWNFALCAALIWVDRKYKLRAGRLFALYVAGYTFWRFWLERLRVDPASKVLGLRVNEWVSVLVFAAALGFFFKGPRELVDEGVSAGAAGGAVEASGGGDGEGQARTPVDVGGDPEVTAVLGKYAFDESFGEVPSYDPTLHQPEPEPSAEAAAAAVEAADAADVASGDDAVWTPATDGDDPAR